VLILMLLGIVVRMDRDNDLIRDGTVLIGKTVQNGARGTTPLTALDVERSLRIPPGNLRVSGAQCFPGADGWDYVCAYETQPGHAWSRVKVGVTVGTTRIIQVSPPHAIGTPLPAPGYLPSRK
jgi:hypothetical protein